MCEGVAAELAGVDLGDQRLNARSQHLLEALAVNPEASINAACNGWSDTLAAYRFFDNRSVTPEKLLEPHSAATTARAREHSVVLAVQDTTELPCTAAFADCEWKSVWRVVTKQPLPKKPPLLAEFMKLLTQLGGYNNRAKEAPPGPQPIWIGIRRMLDFARAWLAFGPEAGTSREFSGG